MPTMLKVGDSEVVRLTQLQDFMLNRGPGEVMIYVRGYIARDLPNAKRCAEDGLQDFHSVVRETMRLWDEGRVHLTQRKLDFCLYEYRIQKRARR